MQLETDRLRIRTARRDDADRLARLWASPRVTRYLGGPRERADLRRLLAAHADDDDPFDLWVLELRDSNQLIGHAGLKQRRIAGVDEVEVIYVLGSRHWGKGYASEACTALIRHGWTLGLERIVAIIDTDNVGSQHVARKAGLRHERDLPRSPAGVDQLWAIERAWPR